jgi:dihydroflavonol-4-reductase
VEVFLTGGTGFIGRRLARRLLDRGWSVTALVRRPASAEARELTALGARLVQGDVTDPASMREPMRGADIVVHNAAWYETGLTEAAREQMWAINVGGTRDTLGLAVALGVPRIVYTSTVLAFGDTGGALADESFRRRSRPATLYEESKTEAHQLAMALLARGAPLIIVCPSSVVGPGDHSLWGHLQRLWVRGLLPPVAWGRDCYQTITHVDDIAEGIALAAERGRAGEIYHLAGEARTIREIVATWAQHPGGQRVRLWMPRPLAQALARPMGALLRAIGQYPFFSSENVAAGYTHMRYSGAKAERELGARFRGQDQVWAETLAAERAALRRA